MIGELIDVENTNGYWLVVGMVSSFGLDMIALRVPNLLLVIK